MFIDDFSRATWLYLNQRMKFFIVFKKFLNRVENQYDAKTKIFRSDNGT